MRIAIPVLGDEVAPDLAHCEAVKFFEDDHGKITRSYRVELAGSGAADALSLIERYGVDAVVAPLLGNDERHAIMLSGLLLTMGAHGDADAAALAYLGQTIAFDPANTCSACGDGLHQCSMDCASCHPSG